MKKIALLVLTGIAIQMTFPQSVGIGTTTPNTNAAPDIESAAKGLLIPRITTVARNAITATKRLMVYDLTTNSFWFHTGTKRNEPASTSNIRLLNGNANVAPGIHFLGTIDDPGVPHGTLEGAGTGPYQTQLCFWFPGPGCTYHRHRQHSHRPWRFFSAARKSRPGTINHHLQPAIDELSRMINK